MCEIKSLVYLPVTFCSFSVRMQCGLVSDVQMTSLLDACKHCKLDSV